jgi:biopolymer transport protein ExbD
MNFSRRRKQTSHIEASSLSDILFFLLLFFLMIATMASPDAIKLLLPNSSTAKHVPKGTVSLSVNAQNQYFVDGKPVDIANMEAVLGAAAKRKTAESVVLRIEKTNTVQDLVLVADVIAKLDLRMVLATDRGK